MNITIGQLIDFIIKYKKKDAFKDYSSKHIYTLIEKSIECGGMVYATNNSGDITGVICCIANPDKKEMFVHDVLTTKKDVLKHFVNYFVNNFEGWNLQAMRRGKLVDYNTSKLCMKILTKQERIA